jgi:hypothetical protein
MTNRNKELNTTINIAENNGYSKEQLIKLNNLEKIKVNNQNKIDKQFQKWAIFTYSGNYIRSITNLFKHRNIRIAYKTNTLGNILKETRNK